MLFYKTIESQQKCFVKIIKKKKQTRTKNKTHLNFLKNRGNLTDLRPLLFFSRNYSWLDVLTPTFYLLITALNSCELMCQSICSVTCSQSIYVVWLLAVAFNVSWTSHSISSYGEVLQWSVRASNEWGLQEYSVSQASRYKTNPKIQANPNPNPE